MNIMSQLPDISCNISPTHLGNKVQDKYHDCKLPAYNKIQFNNRAQNLGFKTNLFLIEHFLQMISKEL